MKYLIASDIHGSLEYCEKLINLFRKEEADRLILLGDILYHGARNNLPNGYDTKSVTALLNLHKDEITCIKGNCDSEIDELVLDFPLIYDYSIIEIDNLKIALTHGHLHNSEIPFRIPNIDVVLHGHFHIHSWEKVNGVCYFNPGSISIPKCDTKHSCIIYENNIFSWVDLEGNIFHQEKVEKHK